MSSSLGMRVELVDYEHRNRCPTNCRTTVQQEDKQIRRQANVKIGPIAGLILLISIVVAAARPVLGLAAEPARGPAAPAVEEWLNQNVRLHDTVQAVDRPSSDGKPSGEIRAGAEVKAIGLVAGKDWVQIELPDHSLAYVPMAAIEFETDAGAPSAPAAARGATPTGAEAASQPTTTPPTTTPPTTTPPAATPATAPGVIRGPVTRVPNAATLVVADQRLRLSGIDPGPGEALAPFESWLRGQGALMCEPDAQTGRYRCFTSGGVDVAEAAILNGAGRVGDGASPEYRTSETQARTAKRGLWGNLEMPQ
jgi:endonuclease YncB( thermonuclease family)